MNEDGFGREHKRKISESQKGRHPSEESRRKMSEPQKQIQINERNKKKNDLFLVVRVLRIQSPHYLPTEREYNDL